VGRTKSSAHPIRGPEKTHPGKAAQVRGQVVLMFGLNSGWGV